MYYLRHYFYFAKRFWHNWIISLFSLLYRLFENRLLLLLFENNDQLGHCMYVDYIPLNVMLRHIMQSLPRQLFYFSQNICMFKYCGSGIFLVFCRNDGMYRICTLFCYYCNFIYELHHSRAGVVVNQYLSNGEDSREISNS